MTTLHDVKVAQEKLKIAQDSFGRVKDEYVRDNCPVKIGDTVEVNGWSHQGKKMIVRHVSLKDGYCLRFRCVGVVLKKDDTESKFEGEHYVCIQESDHE